MQPQWPPPPFSTVPPPPPAPPNAPGENNIGLILVGIVVAAVVIAVIGTVASGLTRSHPSPNARGAIATPTTRRYGTSSGSTIGGPSRTAPTYPSPAYTAPRTYTPTTCAYNPLDVAAPGGNGYRDPAGVFSIQFPSPHTNVSSLRLAVDGSFVAAQSVQSWNGATPWGYWVTWTEPVGTPDPAGVYEASVCRSSGADTVIQTATITIAGASAHSCRVRVKQSASRAWINDYAFVAAQHRLFLFNASEQTTATYQDFLAFVGSFRLGSTTATPTPAGTLTTVPAPSIAIYAGSWVNDDARTSGLTRVLITGGGALHAFARCATTECDLGTQVGTSISIGLMTTFHGPGTSMFGAYFVRTRNMLVTAINGNAVTFHLGHGRQTSPAPQPDSRGVPAP